MHTRRVATFILGAWIAGSLFVIFISLQNFRSVSALLTSPVPQAARIINSVGRDPATVLLRHAAAEQNRAVLYAWESAQLVGVVVLGVFLFLGTQRRVFPMVLCGALLLLVAFQHVGLSTELASMGRETDFPPGSMQIGARTRLLALQEVYYGVEVLKLVAAGILASYLFAFRARRSRRDVNALDPDDSRAVNR